MDRNVVKPDGSPGPGQPENDIRSQTLSSYFNFIKRMSDDSNFRTPRLILKIRGGTDDEPVFDFHGLDGIQFYPPYLTHQARSISIARTESGLKKCSRSWT